MKTMADYICSECVEVQKLLLAKNKAYGNSAADPTRVFSGANSVEQINVRIDDKLSRIKYGNTCGNEDTELDLIGYLILKRAVRHRNETIAKG